MTGTRASLDFHFPVENLDVPVAWRVGRGRFRPRGWLARDIERRWAKSRRPSLDWYVDRVRAEVAALKCATIEVRARDVEVARGRARDAVAVLRLYERARHPRLSLDRQTFGLPADITSGTESYWAVRPDGFPGGGWKRHGVVGSWTFERRDVDEFDKDPAFRFLNAALVARTPGELQRRAVMALQARDSARVSVPPSLRVIGVAVALEAMLGDDDSKERAHRIARRLAFLDCGQPNSRCGRDRLACFYLASKTMAEVDRNVARWREAGHHGRCSAYWRVREVFWDRNDAVHQGSVLSADTASSHAYSVDALLLAALRWAGESEHPEQTDVARLDAEITAAVGKGLVQPPPAQP